LAISDRRLNAGDEELVRKKLNGLKLPTKPGQLADFEVSIFGPPQRPKVPLRRQLFAKLEPLVWVLVFALLDLSLSGLPKMRGTSEALPLRIGTVADLAMRLGAVAIIVFIFTRLQKPWPSPEELAVLEWQWYDGIDLRNEDVRDVEPGTSIIKPDGKHSI